MIPHRPHHWLLVLVVLLVALFTWDRVHGQVLHQDAQAVFEGRPAMPGAQAGQGAMAGPAQGGVGVQGTEAANLRLRRPSGLEPRDMPQGDLSEPPNTREMGAPRDPASPLFGTAGDRRVADRDSGVSRDTGSTTRSAGRSVRRNVDRVRRGGVSLF